MSEKFKQWWIEEHQKINKLAVASKNTMSSLLSIYELYDSLLCYDKNKVDEIFIEWIDKSEINNINNDELYTALACVTEFKIISAVPAMRRLCSRLADCKIPENPQGYNMREKILDKLSKLEVS